MMKVKSLRVIIGLMTLAMIGLVLFQVYWIRDAFKVNNNLFIQNVHEVLNNVVSGLEKQEVFFVASGKLNAGNGQLEWQQKDSDFFYLNTVKSNLSGFDSASIFISQGESNEDTGITFEDSLILGDQKVIITYAFKHNIRTDSNYRTYNIKTERNHLVETEVHAVEDIEMRVEKDRMKFAEKSRMITVVLDELLNPVKSTLNRIDKEYLENLLQYELSGKGINIGFEYAIIDKPAHQFILTRYQPGDETKLLESGFSVRLFPNDLSARDHFLALYFPDQTGFLIKKIWLPLSSSILLVILIMYSFSYSILIIIRQKKVSEIKNDFINNMTHEFKTPISTVSLACEALQDPEINKNQVFFDRYMTIIREENNRLGRQVEKVLQMATIDKSEFRLNLETTNVHQVISKAVDNIRIAVEKRNGKINTFLEASVNEINTDPVHFANIINNLLDNANKYSPQNPAITIHTGNDKNFIFIRISDNGIGMTKDAQDKIFDKFYRVPTGNIHNVKGFGLGLAYVKTMVEVLGGNVHVKSFPGNGSTFEIQFPIRNEQIEDSRR